MRKSLVVLLTVGAGILLHSCNNNSTGLEQPPPTEYAQPAIQPLKFSKPIKINWDTIKAVKVTPIVTKLNWDNLPETPYDTAGFKPFKNPVEETKFDYNSLPEKDLDIDKIPSKPLKFKTYILPPPRLVGSRQPHLKDTSLSLFEFGASQGLLGTTTCLLNDHEGFLWIASSKGVYRYDGGNLLFYIPVETDHFIQGMLQDEAGRIWMTVQNEGLELFDPLAGTLSKTNMALGFGSDNPFGIVQDEQNRIWISAYKPGGVNIIDLKAKTIKWLNKSLGLSDTPYGITMDNRNNIWIGTYKGLSVVDPSNKKIKYLDKAHGLTSDQVDRLMTDRDGNINVGLRGGLIDILNLKRGTLRFIKEAQFPNSYMCTLMPDNNGELWAAAANNGLEIIDPEKRTAKSLKTSDGLAGNFVLNIKQDSRGQVWVATLTGLSMISDKEAVVEHIGSVPTTALAEDRIGLVWQGSYCQGVNIIDRKTRVIRVFNATHGLGNDSVNVIKEINGKMLVSTFNGLDIIDSSRRTITHLGKEQGLDSKVINGILIDKKGKIWLGGTSHGIDVYDPHTNIVKNLGRAQGLSDSLVVDMNVDQYGRIWVSTYSGGVDEIDAETGVIRYLSNAPLKAGDERMLLPDNMGNMWIGTRNGVYIADVKNQTLTSFSTPQGLVDEGVISLLKHNNQIYAGTTKGISVITPPEGDSPGNKNWKVESFGKHYGLNKIEVGYATDLVTKDGLYWWGDKGLTILDLTKKDHYVGPAYIAAIDIMDQPRLFAGRNYTASKGLEWDKVAGPFNMPDNLHLPYNQNYLRFNYGTLNLANTDTTWYKYKLAGADKDWSPQAVSTVSRNYFNMSPGSYTFEVVTKSSENGWSKPAIFSFTINPPWWQTWWAYVIYVILLGGSIWGFSHYRSLQLIKDKRILEHKVHVRTEQVMQQKEEIEAQRDDLDKAFKDLKNTQTQLIQSEKMASLGELTAGIAHEIQNPLNFVNNFSDVNRELLGEMKEEIDKGDLEEIRAIANDLIQNEEKINHHGKRADAIVKGMLQHSKSSSGVKEPTNINALADEYMRLSYHGIRAKDKTFNAEMVTSFDEKLPKVNVIPQDMGRVFLNLFNNAFYAVHQKAKTAGADYQPTVEVTTFFLPLQGVGGLKVRDNGIGIPDSIKEKIMQPFFTTKPTGEGTGLGLSLTYDMVVKGHGGSIQVNSVEGEGSEFVVQLPLP